MRTERRRFVQARDEDTRKIIHGSVEVDRGTGEIRFLIPHKLEGLNQRVLGGPWVIKHRIREAWETAIRICLCDHLGRTSITEFHPHYIRALGFPPVNGKRVITVTRMTPTARNFLKDDDNKPMAMKLLVDAIKNLGLIRADTSKWTSLAPLQQQVSADGRWWTQFVISIPAGESVPFPGAL